MMKQVVAGGLAMVVLGGCGTMNGWTDAAWMKKDYWLEALPGSSSHAAISPAAGKPAAAKLEVRHEAGVAAAKDAKGGRMVRISGLSADVAREGAFEAARTTCAKEEPEQQAHVARDKAGAANGSFFHDVEFDCV